jgi:hypothetical protein
MCARDVRAVNALRDIACLADAFYVDVVIAVAPPAMARTMNAPVARAMT